MAVLSLLTDPKTYRPCTTEDMHTDIPFRDHWVQHFMVHFKMVMRLALEVYGEEARGRTEACYADLLAKLRHVLAFPETYERLDLLYLDGVRQDILIAHGLPDPFELTKARENEASVPLYAGIVAELDALPGADALLLAVEGVFTGNIFDLGARATVDLFENASVDFRAVRRGLAAKRPWLRDDFDAWQKRLKEMGAYRQAMFFCDNAGPDFILGVVPLCRLLARMGTRVVIAANRLPALNDMTAAEVRQLLPRLQALDPTLDHLIRTDRITVIDSGNGIPLIDLREVSDETNIEAARTDLLILEGMGRAVETNLDARFTCDSLKLAMIKDEMVAQRRGGKLFDTICKFDPATPAK